MADSNNEPPVFRAKKVEDGGPAFGYGNHEQGGHSGVSLRDYFAGQALAGITAGLCSDTSVGDRAYDRVRFSHAAEDAYAMADAMLAARSPSTQPE